VSLVSSPKNLSMVSNTALSLFNRQTSFHQAGQEVLEHKLILSKQAADGASFFVIVEDFMPCSTGVTLKDVVRISYSTYTKKIKKKKKDLRHNSFEFCHVIINQQQKHWNRLLNTKSLDIYSL
jgi:hypothetical protein